MASKFVKREPAAENTARPETRGEPTTKNDETRRHGGDVGRAVGPTADDLRAALDAAIVAQRWDAVTAIHARIAELERVGVVDFAAERARREAVR